MTQISTKHLFTAKLKWIVPIVGGSLLLITSFIINDMPHNLILNTIVVLAGIIAPTGGLWALYQCIRYEKTPWKYIPIVVLIPFGFCWYFFEKYRKRENLAESGGRRRD